MKDDYELWLEKFKPILDEDGQPRMFGTYGIDLLQVRNTVTNKIWTLVEEEGLYLCKGYHLVNRLNYFICEVPAAEDDRDYVYDEPEFNE